MEKKKSPTKEAIAIRIQKDNAAYEAMNPMERRVLVSKEILTMIRMGSFTPSGGYGRVRKMHGDYVRLPLIDPECGPLSNRYDFPFGDLQPIIRAGGFECVGCAKAAIIVARAAVGNKVKITKRTLTGGSERLAHKVSKEVFGEVSDIIEGLYEGWELHYRSTSNYQKSLLRKIGKDPKRIEAYNTLCEKLGLLGAEERMKTIYLNIVKSEGYLTIGKFKY